MTRARHLIAAAMLCIATTAVCAAERTTEAGASFPGQISSDAGQISLAGTGVTKYQVIFTVCALGFYVPEGTPKSEILAEDTPRHLEIEYFYDISSEDIVRASMSVLEDQLTDDELTALKQKLNRWHDSYRGVSDGDRYSMTYIPGDGTTLRLNDEQLVTVPGAAFARAYFGIWLKEKAPLSERLRDNLVTELP